MVGKSYIDSFARAIIGRQRVVHRHSMMSLHTGTKISYRCIKVIFVRASAWRILKYWTRSSEYRYSDSLPGGPIGFLFISFFYSFRPKSVWQPLLVLLVVVVLVLFLLRSQFQQRWKIPCCWSHSNGFHLFLNVFPLLVQDGLFLHQNSYRLPLGSWK